MLWSMSIESIDGRGGMRGRDTEASRHEASIYIAEENPGERPLLRS